jgi:hypothetical protein
MNAPAESLRDIHLPSAVAWWPPAPGWWLLALLLAMGLAAVSGWLVIHRRRHRAQRQALAALTGTADAQAVNVLLKRTALAYFDRSRVAPLHGLAWFEFLDAQLPRQAALFCSEAELWQQLLYGREPTAAQTDRFRHLARLWLSQALPPPADHWSRRLRGIRNLLRRRRLQGA